MDGNLNGHNNKTLTHLEKLLEDKPPEFQNKVLRFAYDSGMKANDPAFQFVQYVGYFAAIAENAPQKWQELFNDIYHHFQQIFDKQYKELGRWTDLTEEQLKTFHRHTEIIKNLAESCNQLGNSLSNLEQISQQQAEQFRSLEKLWRELQMFRNVNLDLRNELQTLKSLNLLKEVLLPEGETSWAKENLFTRELAIEAKEKLYLGLTQKIQQELLEENFLKTLLSKIEKYSPKPQIEKHKFHRNLLVLSDDSTVVSILVLTLTFFTAGGFWMGAAVRTWQIQADFSYQQAMQYWEWNRDLIQKAQIEGKTKTTIWIEEPPPK
jgi:hypothetical protein